MFFAVNQKMSKHYLEKERLDSSFYAYLKTCIVDWINLHAFFVSLFPFKDIRGERWHKSSNSNTPKRCYTRSRESSYSTGKTLLHNAFINIISLIIYEMNRLMCWFSHFIVIIEMYNEITTWSTQRKRYVSKNAGSNTKVRSKRKTFQNIQWSWCTKSMRLKYHSQQDVLIVNVFYSNFFSIFFFI